MIKSHIVLLPLELLIFTRLRLAGFMVSCSYDNLLGHLGHSCKKTSQKNKLHNK